jgi:hypothetical protein
MRVGSNLQYTPVRLMLMFSSVLIFTPVLTYKVIVQPSIFETFLYVESEWEPEPKDHSAGSDRGKTIRFRFRLRSHTHCRELKSAKNNRNFYG